MYGRREQGEMRATGSVWLIKGLLKMIRNRESLSGLFLAQLFLWELRKTSEVLEKFILTDTELTWVNCTDVQGFLLQFLYGTHFDFKYKTETHGKWAWCLFTYFRWTLERIDRSLITLVIYMNNNHNNNNKHLLEVAVIITSYLYALLRKKTLPISLCCFGSCCKQAQRKLIFKWIVSYILSEYK